ncbi:MAG: universal stress protein [Candidatus Eiseniibacteriota bacterium]
MSPARSIALKRILLALDGLNEDPATLSAAVELAARLHVELEGLFIEDVDLLRSAALPFVHQVDVLTGESAAFESEPTERGLRESAGRAEQRLAREAQRLHVQWTFRTVRGSIAGTVREAARQVDLVVLSEGPRLRGAAAPLGRSAQSIAGDVSRPVLVLRPGAPLAGPVVAVLDDESKAKAVLEWAARLAARDDSEVRILSPTPRIRIPAPRGVEFSFIDVPRLSREHLLLFSGMSFGGIVVLASNSPLLTSPGVETFLARLSRPILVVR